MLKRFFTKSIWKVISRSKSKHFSTCNDMGDRSYMVAHLLILENQFGKRDFKVHIDEEGDRNFILEWEWIDRFIQKFAKRELKKGISAEKFNAKYGTNIRTYKDAKWILEDYEKSFSEKLGHVL